MSDDTNRISYAVAAPAILALAGLAAYVFQQARASAHATHFGVHHGLGDTRQAAIPMIGLGILVVTFVATMVAAARLADVAAPTVVLVVASGAVVLRLAGVDSQDAAVLLGGYVLVVLMCVRLWRAGRRGVAARAAEDPESWSARFVSHVARVRTVLRPPPFAGPLVLPLVILWAAWTVGTWGGELEAEGRTDFDVIRRDRSTATVIFTRTGDIVERVLDISPGADGQPRNVWLSGVTIRPMPAGGIRYETVRLGKTHRAGVEEP